MNQGSIPICCGTALYGVNVNYICGMECSELECDYRECNDMEHN